jgi:serine/threonine protein kinase
MAVAGGSEQSLRKGCITCSREFGGEFTLCPHDGTRLTPLSKADLLGTVLDGRYEILEVLGGGGMGLVYKARHSYMKRTVAVKVLHKHMVASTEALKRFRLEAQAVSCLNVPNILTVYDFGVSTQGQPYMVMDYLEGTSLHEVLEAEHNLSVERSLNIFIQICRALEHAHEKNVIHRDLKPSNIMLVSVGDEKDFVKIVDFGIAKLLGAAEGEMEQLTRTGEVFGSPLYMSPEQCRGKPLDCRTDIYSLGSVMYETLTGKPLFEGDEVLDLFFKQTTQKPAAFSAVSPTLAIPQELEQIVFRTLEKEPEDRIPTMRNLRLELEQIGQNQPGPQQSQGVALATGRLPQVVSDVKTSLPSSPLTASLEGSSSAVFQAATTGATVPMSGQNIGKRTAIIILGCAILFISLLAIAFVLGRDQAIVEESKLLKDAATEKGQTESASPPVVKQSVAPPTPTPKVNIPNGALKSGNEEVSEQKKARAADVTQKRSHLPVSRSNAQRTRGDRTAVARQVDQADRGSAVTEPPIAPSRSTMIDRDVPVTGTSATGNVPQTSPSSSSIGQTSESNEKHGSTSKIWAKLKKDEAVRHSIFKKAVRIIKDSLSE